MTLVGRNAVMHVWLAQKYSSMALTSPQALKTAPLVESDSLKPYACLSSLPNETRERSRVDIQQYTRKKLSKRLRMLYCSKALPGKLTGGLFPDPSLTPREKGN